MSARLTPPLLLTPHTFQSNPTLPHHFIALCNEAFCRSQLADPEKWTYPKLRFVSTQQLFSEFSDSDGIIALILDEAETDKDAIVEVANDDGEVKRGKLVACAGVVPWKGGWQSEDPGEETGWEVKTVCVDKGERYARTGLAVGLMRTLEQLVVRIERERLRNTLKEGTSHEKAERARSYTVNLWVTAAECVNGDYWRKRGFKEIRRQTWRGIWGCKTSFEMLTMNREVEFNL